MTRICAHCGTEVDGEALFCPTCGQPLAAGEEPELPAAPDWPELPPRPTPETPVVTADEVADDEPVAPDGTSDAPAPPASLEPAEPAEHDGPTEPAEAPAPAAAAPPSAPSPPSSATESQAPATHGWERPVSEQPVPPWRRGAALRSSDETSGASDATRAVPPASPPAATAAAAAEPAAPAARPAGMVRVPTLLSDWCAGAGAVLALVAMFLPWRIAGGYTAGWGFASGVNLLISIALLALLAIVFLPDMLPRIPQRALVLLSVGLVGVGIGLDRLGQPLTGAGGVLFLIAAIVIAAGGAMAQLDYDRPVGGPQA